MKYIFIRALVAPPMDELASITDRWTGKERSRFTADVMQVFVQEIEQLRNAGLWSDVEDSERTFLQAGVDQITPQQRIDGGWLAESIASLLWALQIVPELPGYDEQASHELVKMTPVSPVRNLIRDARLRPQPEIRRQREIAELWHWRSRTRRLQEEGRLNGPLLGGHSIEQIIELAAVKGAERNDLPTAIGSDFPVLGKPYRDLSFEEFAMVSSIAQERHKAFNWLCGLSPTGRWSDTPTDT